MFILDTALQERARINKPIRVGIIGAGFLSHAIVDQIVNVVPGMEVVAVSGRRIPGACDVYSGAGVQHVRVVETVQALEEAILLGTPAVCESAEVLCEADGIDVIVEATGSPVFAADAALKAIRHGKHLIINAEVDGTLGPILKTYADRAGVIVTGIDGDQPGTELNLYRYIKGMGLTPLLCGNIKTLQDPYRTPATQKAFAQQWGITPLMATSFVDGTKISFEQATVANATGMRVAKRGMLGYRHDGHVSDVTTRYDVEELRSYGGIVDYVLGAQPGPGVFVLATTESTRERHRLRMYKMGDGPLYCFYAPYHLCHFELPFAIARAALFHDAVVAPVAGPCMDVVATAKINLRAGDVLDGIGGFTTYGQCENSDTVETENLLPIGLAAGCRVRCDVPRDQVLTYADVIVPQGRTCDMLRSEQNNVFFGQHVAAGAD